MSVGETVVGMMALESIIQALIAKVQLPFRTPERPIPRFAARRLPFSACYDTTLIND